MRKNSRVYVGTYEKYNNGSLFGEWVDLTQFSNIDEFYKYIRRLHKDEPDPEFMFQDWENIPSVFISESYISPAIWDLMNSGVDMDIIFALAEYLQNEDDLIKIIENGDFTVYYDVNNDEDLGYEIVDNVYGGVENLGKETLESYFGYDSFGRDLQLEGTFIPFEGGMIELHY